MIEVIPKLLLEINKWDYCTLNILKREVIYCCFNTCTTAAAALLLFMVASSETFELLACTNSSYAIFDVLTRFDHDYWVDYAFGKKDEERAKWNEKDPNRKRKKYG